MVRSVDRDKASWLPVFAVADAQEADVRVAGCEVLAAAGDSVPRIMSSAFVSDWPGAGWRLRHRDPTSVSLQTPLCDEAGAGTGNVSARLVAQLEDATLSLALTAHNDGVAATLLAFGLRAFIPPGLVHGSRLLVARAGDEPVSLRLPIGSDADGVAATTDRTLDDRPSRGGRTLSDDTSRVVVSCDESVHQIELQRPDPAGNLALMMLGASRAFPVRIGRGACAGLAISITVLPDLAR